MIIEGEFPVKIETEPTDELRRRNGYVLPIDERGQRRGGVVATSIGKVHQIRFVQIDLHADRRKKSLSLVKSGFESNHVFFEGVGNGKKSYVVNVGS